jgi:hypothetical protein
MNLLGEVCRATGHKKYTHLAQDLHWGGHLLLTDLLVLLLLGGGLQSLPGEGAPVEVHEDVAQGLHVVSPALFDSQMGVDRGVAGRPGQILVLSNRKENNLCAYIM